MLQIIIFVVCCKPIITVILESVWKNQKRPVSQCINKSHDRFPLEFVLATSIFRYTKIKNNQK